MSKILLYGDSLLSHITTLPSGDMKVTNACVSGLTIKTALQEESKRRGISSFLQKESFDFIFICLGTNDIGQGDLPHREVIPNLMLLLKTIQSHAHQIVVFGFPYAETASRDLQNQLVQADENLGGYIEFPQLDEHPEWVCDDGIHLNRKGEEHVAALIAGFIDKKLREFKLLLGNISKIEP